MTVPVPGAYGVVRTNGWEAFMIRLGTRSQFNHAFIYLGNGRLMEAQPKGAGVGYLVEYKGKEIRWSDASTLTDDERHRIIDEAIAMDGTPYGWLDIAALGLLCLGFKWDWLFRKAKSAKTLICSQLVARAYDLAGVDLFPGVDDGLVTPGMLADRIGGN